MIEWLMSGAAGAELFGDVPESTMYPIEAQVVRAATAERRREFGTVRHCARQALLRIGVPAAPVLPDADGAPGWPAGVVGSMTHCAGYRAAAVAYATDLAAIGIDAEPHAPLPPSTLDLVLRDDERVEHLVLSRAYPWLHWDRLLFCAKEAVYKAWFPLTRRWLGFDDVAIGVHPDGTFRAQLMEPAPTATGPDLSRMDGRWAVGRGLVVTVTTVAGPGFGASGVRP
jgi:4'-phosphopantetheinyl transferase EntD